MIGKRYKNLFQKLKSKKEGAFIPFVILGDPNFDLSLKIIDNLIKSGADALELGFPFSDPIADGKIIQKSILRAFSSGTTVKSCFKLIKIIRKRYQNIPIGLLIYANLVFNKGIENFYNICQKVEIDSVLIPDIPIEESKIFRKIAFKNNIAQIFICPPDANDHLIYLISIYGSAYTYLLSRLGVTGNTKSEHITSLDVINKLKKYNAPKILQGFGISKPIEVKKAMNNGVFGVICGSAIVSIIEKNINNLNKLLFSLKEFVIKMKNATKKF